MQLVYIAGTFIATNMNKFIKILKDNGCKLTNVRLSVLGILESEHGLLSAQDIYQKLHFEFDLASVYRSLSLFQGLGIVFSEKVSDREFFYLDTKPHHHIVCRKCGYNECVPCDHLTFSFKNFSNIAHNLTLSGVCKTCKF